MLLNSKEEQRYRAKEQMLAHIKQAERNNQAWVKVHVHTLRHAIGEGEGDNAVLIERATPEVTNDCPS